MNTYSCARASGAPRLLALLRLDPVRRVPRVVPRVLEVDRVLLLGELPLAVLAAAAMRPNPLSI